MADAEYSETEDPKITFGLKGELNNRALLSLIQRQEPLAPAALFKMARFFNNTLLNASLGESLELSGLATIVAALDLQKPIQEHLDINGREQYDQSEDQFPFDWPPAYYDERSEDTVSVVAGHAINKFDGLSFIFVPLFDNGNSGLLIKTQDTETQEILYFIVGVCPNPNNLSFPSTNRASTRRRRNRQN